MTAQVLLLSVTLRSILSRTALTDVYFGLPASNSNSPRVLLLVFGR